MYGNPRMISIVLSRKQRSRSVLRASIVHFLIRTRQQTLDLIPLYSDIKPQDPTLEFTLPSESPDSLSGEGELDFDASLAVFSANKQVELSNRFRKDADAFYVEAKRSTVAGIAQIPTWLYGVLVVLGWNEAMMILFNPLYFTLALLVVASSWVIHQLGLSGPLLQVSKTVAGEAGSFCS